ncbi:hypothetical protein FWF89_01850 [Candidatus Saccharibacteria bacterium]|nr:hypothetical protein [Candidatus Saccharibacteria bacterium]
MSKKIIAGALGVATIVGSFAILAVPTFADPGDPAPAWHQVTVTPDEELILGGTGGNALLTPSLTTNDDWSASTLTVKSTEAWELEWQAVTGAVGAESTTGATGTTLGSTGFTTGTSSTGYEYRSTGVATAGTANTWSAALAVTGGSGGSMAGSYALATTLSTIATGTATSGIVITPTYSASTDGTLGANEFYGTIYYLLSAAVSP